MRRWEFGGGIWLRLGRYWYGVLASWPLFARVPVIAGGSEGMAAQGSYLMIGDGASPEVFTEIAEVTSISGPSLSRERIDFTHLRSVGSFREFKGSFIDPGELTFRVQYNRTAHATHDLLGSKVNAAEPDNFRLVFPDASGWDFAGTVTGFALTGIEVGGKIEVDVTLSLSGAVDFSGAGSPS